MSKTTKKTTDKSADIARRFGKILSALRRDAADLVSFAFANWEDKTEAAGICKTTVNSIRDAIDVTIEGHGVSSAAAEAMAMIMAKRVEELAGRKGVR